MFGPVMISIRVRSPSAKSFGTNGAPLERSTPRCRPRAVLEHGLFDELRLDEIERAHALCEIRERVELGDAFGRLLQLGEPRPKLLEQRVVERFLAAERALARAQTLSSNSLSSGVM